MKDLASVTKQGIQKLIDCNVLSGWNDSRIQFPCPYSDDNKHYMVSFDTSQEQAFAYDVVFNMNDVEAKVRCEYIRAVDDVVREVCRKFTEFERAGVYRFYCVEIKQIVADIADKLKDQSEHEEEKSMHIENKITVHLSEDDVKQLIVDCIRKKTGYITSPDNVTFSIGSRCEGLGQSEQHYFEGAHVTCTEQQ